MVRKIEDIVRVAKKLMRRKKKNGPGSLLKFDMKSGTRVECQSASGSGAPQRQSVAVTQRLRSDNWRSDVCYGDFW